MFESWEKKPKKEGRNGAAAFEDVGGTTFTFDLLSFCVSFHISFPWLDKLLLEHCFFNLPK